MNKIITIFSLLISFSNFAIAGGSDSTSISPNANALSQPSLVITQSITLPTNVPSGTLCGAMEDWNWSPVPCMGQNIKYGCPTGFHLTAIYNNRNNVLYSCAKD